MFVSVLRRVTLVTGFILCLLVLLLIFRFWWWTVIAEHCVSWGAHV